MSQQASIQKVLGVFLGTVCWMSASLADLNVDEIYRFESCAPYENEKVDAELQNQLANPANFPQWGTTLKPYLTVIEKFQGGAPVSDCRLGAAIPKGPHPATIALAKVLTGTIGEMEKDLAAQKQFLTLSKRCLANLKTTSKEVPVNPADFVREFARRDAFPTAQNCSNFLNTFLEELRGRHLRMRMYMALKKGPPFPADEKLKHDEAYTQFITKTFFPSMATRVSEVTSLTSQEISALPEFSRSLKWSPAILYDVLLSATPILLQFPDRVDLASLKIAVANMSQQIAHDKVDALKNPSQEILLQTPYVEAAIKNLDEADRPLACKAVRAIYKNLQVKYERLPMVSNGVAILVSIPSGGTGLALRELVGAFVQRAGVSLTAVTAVNQLNSFKRYSDAISLCSGIVAQRNEAPDVDGICNLATARKIQMSAESNLAVGAVMGATFAGAGRAIKGFGALKTKRPETIPAANSN